MTDRDDFLFAICSEPGNLLHRLVFADWLDEHDDPKRAEYIRLTCTPKPPGCDSFMYSCSENNFYGTDLACPNCKESFRWDGMQAKAKVILHNNWRWKEASGLGGIVFHDPGDEEPLYLCDWNNGFVESVTCNGSWKDFLTDAPVVFRNHPVREFRMAASDPEQYSFSPEWFSDQGAEEIDVDFYDGGRRSPRWIPWAIAKGFEPATGTTRTGMGTVTRMGGRYDIPSYIRHEWRFTDEEEAYKFLSEQICKYGFKKAWEDRLCSAG